MAQYGGEQLMKPEGHQTEEHTHNPHHSTTTPHDIGGTGATMGMGAGHGCQEAKHGGDHVDDHKGSATATVGDGVGLGKYDGHENKGMVEKIKEKLPGGEHGGDEHKSSATTTVDSGVGVGGCEGVEGHEKKGLMEKIKEKLPGANQ